MKKRKVNKRIGRVQDSHRACGSTQEIVVCNGQNHMQNKGIFKLRSFPGAVNWVCDDALDEHVWVSEQTFSSQEVVVLEALQYDLDIPCIVQW